MPLVTPPVEVVLSDGDRALEGTLIRGGFVTKKAKEAIVRICHEYEHPLMVFSPGGSEGIMVVFTDRLAIIKTGALTSLMAGSMGGERSTTFFFSDINAPEYNSGLTYGVLEVLTASYQGGTNKDFWNGSTKSTNANSDNPFTLSNTLPLSKALCAEWAPDIQRVRGMVSDAKGSALQAIPPAAKGLAEQIQELAALRDAGILTEGEFTSAKARLIG